MCGFVSILGVGGRRPESHELQPMMDAIRHRGPDDEGQYIDGWVGFGFRRLSILDLSAAGHQPMTTDDGNLTIVFNGEVYNYLELRAELIKLGHRFHSKGDTEVLLHAYQQWGRDCVTRFNGMWALLIHDKRTNSVFGSRDRFGVKPLYRYRVGDRLFFASEIKAMRQAPGYRFEPNWQVANRFLQYGELDHQLESFYQGIESVEPGTCFEVDANGGWKSWKYWDLENPPSVDTSHPIEQFAELFEDSVRLRMRSDVPLAVFLSGGLDSTSIICSIARQRQRAGGQAGELTAYAYRSAEFDENEYIDMTLQATGARLHAQDEHPATMWEDIQETLRWQDEPVHSFTPAAARLLSKAAAADGNKVILNGQGADESIAGYGGYFPELWYTQMVNGQWSKLWDNLGQYSAHYGGSRVQLLATVARRVLQSQFQHSTLYLQLAGRRQRARQHANPWYSSELAQHAGAGAAQPHPSGLDPLLRYSMSVDPLPLYLRIEDRNAMAHSVEIRLPFLDYRLISLLFNLPAELKMQGKWNKVIQRQAMRERIPEPVRARVDKMGFPVPNDRWMREDLFDSAYQLVSSSRFRQRGFFDAKAIEKDLIRHRNGEVNMGLSLFNTIQFEWWLEQNETSV